MQPTAMEATMADDGKLSPAMAERMDLIYSIGTPSDDTLE
jgi:hypothetical protein